MDSQFKEEFALEMPEVRTCLPERQTIRRRKKKRSSKPVFKKYEQDQMNLLPQNLEELIAEKHLVRVLNKTIDKLNIVPLVETYKGGGASSYHPLMLLKVLLFAYLDKVYSSRMIAKALRENIYFMWLSGNNQPDFRTINDFRLRLAGVVEEIFVSMILFLSEHKYIELEKYFLDGSKFRADAKKTSYVWRKNTERYKESVEQRVKELLKQIEEINQEEEKKYGNKDLPEMGEDSPISSEEIKEKAKQISEKIKGKTKWLSGSKADRQAGKEVKDTERMLKRIEKEIPKLEKYEQQGEKLNGRNSYSHTDNDATFFQMKNKELIPAYSVQIGTEKRIS